MPFVRTVKPDGCEKIFWGTPSDPFAVAAAFDPDGKRGLLKLPTTRAPSRMTAVLLNRQRHLIDVDLLDHTGLAPGRGFQPMAAPGTKIDTMIERPVVDGLGRERIPFV